MGRLLGLRPTMSLERGHFSPTTSSAFYWVKPDRRGLAEYQTKIAELLAAYPDLRLELIDSATVAGKGPTARSWSICITSAGRPDRTAVQIRGLDRARSRNGIVVENVIRYDPAGCRALSAISRRQERVQAAA